MIDFYLDKSRCNDFMVFIIHAWYLLSYLLIYPMEQSPSWEANGFSASQEISPHFMEPQGSSPHSQVPHLSLFWTSPIQCTSWKYILILSFYLGLGLPSGLFPSGFPTTNLYTPLFSPIRSICRPLPPFNSSRFYHSRHIGWGVHIIKLLIM
jgi:hypothetical protein